MKLKSTTCLSTMEQIQGILLATFFVERDVVKSLKQRQQETGEFVSGKNPICPCHNIKGNCSVV